MNIISRCASFLVVSVALVGAVDARAAAPSLLAIDNDLMRETATTLIDNDAKPLDDSMANDLALDTIGNGNGIGIGLQVGSPSALTIKFSGLQQTGFVLGIGAGFGYVGGFSSSLRVHGDYLFTLAKLVDSSVDLTFYGGPGAFAQFFGTNYGFGGRPYYNDFDFLAMGLRLPFGLSMSFDGAPLEIYLEANPELYVFPVVAFGVGGSLGFRFYF